MEDLLFLRSTRIGNLCPESRGSPPGFCSGAGAELCGVVGVPTESCPASSWLRDASKPPFWGFSGWLSPAGPGLAVASGQDGMARAAVIIELRR